MQALSAGGALALAALMIFAYGLVGRRLGRWNLTAPILFMASGWFISLIFTTTQAEVATLRVLAEATLAIVLFTDAAGVRPSQIEGQGGPVARLLLVALPLTILAGTLLALGLWPEMPVFAALLLAAMLAPTDAALGAATVLNKAVPVRIRRILNVESGLNDGLATPVVFFAIAALAGSEGISASNSATEALVEIGLGALLGAAIGFAAGRLLRWSLGEKVSTPRGQAVSVLMLPVFAYILANLVSANGFIAAFVAGSFFAAAWRSGRAQESLELAESVTEPMADITWLSFGVFVVPLLLVNLGWQEVVFAVAALTVLRMGPVALALLGSGFRPQTVAFIGWFGPRGLATIVFAMIAVESLEMDAVLEDVLATATLTIIGSVILHGLTAGPGARKYGNWVRRTRPVIELADSTEPRSRGRLASQQQPE